MARTGQDKRTNDTSLVEVCSRCRKKAGAGVVLMSRSEDGDLFLSRELRQRGGKDDVAVHTEMVTSLSAAQMAKGCSIPPAMKRRRVAVCVESHRSDMDNVSVIIQSE